MNQARSQSWYLDPLAASQKQRVHLELIARWAPPQCGLLLKTDLFEEANGDDDLLYKLKGRAVLALGIDINLETACQAKARVPGLPDIAFVGADARALPLRTNSVDVIVSNSTLDHFRLRSEFEKALAELARVLRPGGCLILTVDNVLNPLYWPLRWLSWAAPFRLGYSPSPRELNTMLGEASLSVAASEQLIHNPRMLSTLVFLGLRAVLGHRADGPISALLRCFDGLGRLPTRRFTACFWAVRAGKPQSPAN